LEHNLGGDNILDSNSPTEEGKIDDVGTGDMASDKAVEKPRKRKQASKKGELREQIQNAIKPSPPPTAKKDTEKRKVSVEEE
jgi:hypothetical protein